MPGESGENWAALLPGAVVAMLRKSYPDRTPTPAELRRLQAEIGDDFVPGAMLEPRYAQFLGLKIRFVMETKQEAPLVLEGLKALANGLADEIRADSRDNNLDDKARKLTYWLYESVNDFRRHVKAETMLPTLEQRMMENAGATLTMAATERSMAAMRVIAADRDGFEGLPPALMKFIVSAFSDRTREDPFWERIQRQIGPYFQEEALREGDEDYQNLLWLQVRFYGFLEPKIALLSKTEELELSLEVRLDDEPRGVLLNQLQNLKADFARYFSFPEGRDFSGPGSR